MKAVGDTTAGRNIRSVWTIATRPYPGAHFATFPPALVEPCIKAGCPPAGKRCDCDEIIETPLGSGPINDPSIITGRAGYNRPRRDGEGTRPITRREQRAYAEQMKASPHRAEMERICGSDVFPTVNGRRRESAFAHYIRTDASGARPLPPELLTDFLARGWLTEPPPCTHTVEPPGVVLDPFGGSGTVGVVANKLSRRAILIELNPEYGEQIEKRNAQSPMGLAV